MRGQTLENDDTAVACFAPSAFPHFRASFIPQTAWAPAAAAAAGEAAEQEGGQGGGCAPHSCTAVVVAADARHHRRAPHEAAAAALGAPPSTATAAATAEQGAAGMAAAPPPAPAAPAPSRGFAALGGPHRPALQLDLSALPGRGGGGAGPGSSSDTAGGGGGGGPPPPSEAQLKRQKFAAFERHCSRVADGLYVAGEAVAKDRAALAAHGVTHVVNCVGALYPEFFAADGVRYLTLWLQDHPQEDLTCVLYDVFDFIEAAHRGGGGSGNGGGNGTPPSATAPASQQQQQQQQQRAGGGRVLVHCSQGVSRSTALAIGYLMWRGGLGYDDAYAAVRAARGVASPNVGFMCQLINWAKRRARPPGRVRLYRVAPHCADAAGYLVPKGVGARPGCAHPDWACLDSRGCFVVHLPACVYVWRGAECLGAMADAGVRAARQLARYEGAPAPPLLVRQGDEPAELLAALAPAPCGSGGGGGSAGGLSSHASSDAADGFPLPSSPPPLLAARPSGDGSSSGSGGGGGGSRPGSAPAAPAAMDADVASALLSAQLSAGASLHQHQHQQQQQQQRRGLLGVVGEVQEYTGEFELWYRSVLLTRAASGGGGTGGGGGGSTDGGAAAALLCSGGGGSGCSSGGRLTPRGSLAGLVQDDMAASPGASPRASAGGGGSGGGNSVFGIAAGGFSGALDGGARGGVGKHRRGEGGRAAMSGAGRPPGRLSASVNGPPWAAFGTAAAALGGPPAAAGVAGPAAAGGGASSSQEAGGGGDEEDAAVVDADVAAAAETAAAAARQLSFSNSSRRRMSIDGEF